MCCSVCVACPFMDQCIRARCFEYQTRLLARTSGAEQIARGHSPRRTPRNRLPRKCLLPPAERRYLTAACERPLSAQFFFFIESQTPIASPMFSCVAEAERGNRERIKVFLSRTCLFSSCSPEYTRLFCLITVRGGRRLPSTTGLSLVLPCTQRERERERERRLLQVEARPIFSGAMKSVISARARLSEAERFRRWRRM